MIGAIAGAGAGDAPDADRVIVDDAPAGAATETPELEAEAASTRRPATPAWVTPEAITFADEATQFMDDVSQLSSQLAPAFTSADIASATALTVDAWMMFRDAPEVPADAPFADEWRVMIIHGEATFDLLSDALIEMDTAKMSKGSEMVQELAALMGDFTDAINDATAELTG